MEKSPEQIREYFINNFGLELPIEKCTTYLTAYNTIARLTTVNLVRVVNRKLLEEIAGSEEDFEEASKSGAEIDKHIIKSFYFRYFLKVNSKEKEEVIGMDEKKFQETIDKEQSDLKRIKINDFLNVLGLEAQEELFSELDFLSLDEIEKMDEITFIKFIIKNDKANYITAKVKEQSRIREILKKLPSDVKNEVFDIFCSGNYESIRGYADEDVFISNLRKAGVYVTEIDDSALEIKSLEDLVRAIENKQVFPIYRDSLGIKGSLDNKKSKNIFIKKIKEKLKGEVDFKEPKVEEIEPKVEEIDIMDWTPVIDDEFLFKDDPVLVDMPKIIPQPKPEKEYKLAVNTIKGEDISNDKESMDAMFKQNYMLYGKDGITKSFEQYINKKGRISKVNVGTDSYEYNNEIDENIALKVLNAKYIEYVLKNAKDIEYNFDLNPKARRLGEAIIAMYSKLKTAEMEESYIMDQINDALENGIIDGNLHGFDVINEPLKDKKTINIANDRIIDKEEFSQKRLELEYISSKDIINIMVSAQLDSIFDKEKKEAKDEGREAVIKSSQLDELLDEYNKNNDNTQISTHKLMKFLKNENKSTEEANARAQKTQLLQYVAEHKMSFKPALDIPENINCRANAQEVDKAISESLVDFIKLKGEIENLRAEITNKRIKNEEVKDEETMLRSLLNIYFEKYENEETKKLYSTYIALNETVKKHEKAKQKSGDREP